jgi:hypothetical protein
MPRDIRLQKFSYVGGKGRGLGSNDETDQGESVHVHSQ